MTGQATLTENGMKRQEALIGVYLKIVSTFLLMFTTWYWARLVGYLDPGLDFSTMGFHWQVALCVLAVFQPVAALGLWGNTYWGVVTWLIVIITEVMMYGVFPELYGFNNPVLWFHVVSFGVYAMIAGLIWFRRRATEQKNAQQNV